MGQELNRLRYSISDWSQATRCLSNNSKDLRISVTSYVHNTDFEGRIISVVHTKFGTMFATITDGRGYLISASDEDDCDLPLMTTDEILIQLEKFGFDISYEEEPNLSGEQLTFLMKLQDLGYDAVTKIRVQYPKTSRTSTIAYNSSRHVDYLSFNTVVPKSKFDESLEDGSIVNVAKMDATLKWDWLTYTCQIDDILEMNSVHRRIDERCPEPSQNNVVIHDPATYSADPSTFHVYGEVEFIENDNADNTSSTGISGDSYYES